MRLRARPGVGSLQNYRLDSTDVFLLSRLDAALSPAELTDISPCGHDETSRRVRTLISFGLIEVVVDSDDDARPSVPAPAPRPPEAPAQQAITIPPSRGFAEALLESGRRDAPTRPPAGAGDGRATERLTRPKKPS